ncbi:hypothetical protein FFR93_00255 [Rhizobium sp. MHM7A]|nr:hypothetical protein FFR93_00255 [Rhizobium sp. MHM7A]
MTYTRTLILKVIVVAATVLLASGHAHQPGNKRWTYPPACCNGSDVSGDCERIPDSAVRKGREGFSVILHPGDHHLVTREHRFLIPYGSELPSGDSDFHICLHPTEHHANCFFAPPDGA